jgi:hypothetical protein
MRWSRCASASELPRAHPGRSTTGAGATAPRAFNRPAPPCLSAVAPSDPSSRLLSGPTPPCEISLRNLGGRPPPFQILVGDPGGQWPPSEIFLPDVEGQPLPSESLVRDLGGQPLPCEILHADLEGQPLPSESLVRDLGGQPLPCEILHADLEGRSLPSQMFPDGIRTRSGHDESLGRGRNGPSAQSVGASALLEGRTRTSASPPVRRSSTRSARLPSDRPGWRARRGWLRRRARRRGGSRSPP